MQRRPHALAPDQRRRHLGPRAGGAGRGRLPSRRHRDRGPRRPVLKLQPSVHNPSPHPDARRRSRPDRRRGLAGRLCARGPARHGAADRLGAGGHQRRGQPCARTSTSPAPSPPFARRCCSAGRGSPFHTTAAAISISTGIAPFAGSCPSCANCWPGPARQGRSGTLTCLICPLPLPIQKSYFVRSIRRPCPSTSVATAITSSTQATTRPGRAIPAGTSMFASPDGLPSHRSAWDESGQGGAAGEGSFDSAEDAGSAERFKWAGRLVDSNNAERNNFAAAVRCVCACIG